MFVARFPFIPELLYYSLELVVWFYFNFLWTRWAIWHLADFFSTTILQCRSSFYFERLQRHEALTWQTSATMNIHSCYTLIFHVHYLFLFSLSRCRHFLPRWSPSDNSSPWTKVSQATSIAVTTWEACSLFFLLVSSLVLDLQEKETHELMTANYVMVLVFFYVTSPLCLLVLHSTWSSRKCKI